jgi:[ribosomal protein S5]-alanine N-acetyltransferase
MNISLFHGLEGESIYFKALTINDAEEVHKYASDEDVSRFIGWRLMHTLNETREYIEEMLKRESAGTHIYASIVLKSTQAIIGTAMIFNFDKEANHAEIGYVFHKDHWGKGYGTETVALMSDFAFKTLNLHKLHASVVAANIGSSRILEKNGFELEGRFKDHYFIEGRYYDGLFFGKLQPEWI